MSDYYTCGHCGGSGRYIHGWALRRVREQAGLSQRELARRMGVSVQYVSQLEHERRSCNGPRADAYMEACK